MWKLGYSTLCTTKSDAVCTLPDFLLLPVGYSKVSSPSPDNSPRSPMRLSLKSCTRWCFCSLLGSTGVKMSSSSPAEEEGYKCLSLVSGVFPDCLSRGVCSPRGLFLGSSFCSMLSSLLVT